MLPPAIQVVPLNASVLPTPPANAKAAFCVPAPARPLLALIIAVHADQDVPLYASVHANAAGAGLFWPPKINAAS